MENVAASFYFVRQSGRPELWRSDALRSRGHEIDDCDLCAERFNPVMSEQERMQYHAWS
jgi:hypothetical protein